MKKLTILLSTMFLATICVGQTEASDYNKWSVEFNLGQNKPNSPFAPGYFSSDPNTYFNFNGVEHVDLGVRYMFNPYFGAKLDFGYDVMKNQEGTASLPFETQQYRVGLQGVVNVSRLLKFESFTNRFGLLLHGGLQVSQLAPQIGSNSNVTEDNGGLMLGLTPQVRLSKRIVLTADFTYIGNVRQHFNWDGSVSNVDNNLTGSLINTSIGLTVYLGKKDRHADWYVQETMLVQPIEKYDDEGVLKRLEMLERGTVDSDNDGVVDSRDIEPNTIAGLRVDSQGKAFDLNKNGVPDEQEGLAVAPSTLTTTTTDPALMAIIEFEYNIMYYDNNRIDPNKESRVKLKYLIDYLQKNPDVNIRLEGYTDALGSIQSNNKLSDRRVKKLKEILGTFNIAPERIDTAAKGIDTMFSNSNVGQPLARRVNVIIK